MANKIHVQKLNSLDDMLLMYPLVKQLSKKLLTKKNYKAYLQEMIPHNYYQVAAYQNDELIAVSGYWIATKLYCGRYFEIDNFIVTEHARSSGVGTMMIDWMEKEAKSMKCNFLMLDAYTGNKSAHRFYLRLGFNITGFHFMKEVVG